ncbi:unnamed protein product [Prorocentrum cordatum]|uniref:Uncharacterized protein n=1 Tax=Prorocentrum cordatum TaxID=2364126 RepID=A0ABN9R0X8_9DINO|nr:unnamed protein product [Polarella glacialis]
MRLIDAGQPVESLETAKKFLEEAAPEGFDQQLLATEILDQGFRELRAVCESLAAGSGKTPSRVNDAAETRLKANIACLEGLRAQHEARPMTARELAELGDEAAAASHKLELELTKRQERVAKLINSIGDFPTRRQEVMATCLSCERMRRQRFEEFLAALQKLLWGEDSFAEFAHDPTLAPTTREVIKRASGLVDQAWRDMVGVAAEALDDRNPIGAQSEDMSNAANQYKAMRQELQKNFRRLGTLEEKALEGPPPPRAQGPKAAAPAKTSTAAAQAPQPKTTASAAGAPSATTTASPPEEPHPAASRAPAAPTPPSSPPVCQGGALPAEGPSAEAGLAAVAGAGAAGAAAVTAGALASTGAPTAQAARDAPLPPAPVTQWSRLPSVGTWLVVRLQEAPQPEVPREECGEPPCVVQACPEPGEPSKTAMEPPCVLQECPEPEEPPETAIEPPCAMQECPEPEKPWKAAVEAQERAELEKPPMAEVEAPRSVAEEVEPAEAPPAAAEEAKLAEPPVEAPASAADEAESALAATEGEASPEAAPAAPT